MVELTLNHLFGALANEHRRDILRRCGQGEQTAGRLAGVYGMTLAAVAKHIGVLERAGLVVTEKVGTERRTRLSRPGLAAATDYLHDLEAYWNSQLDNLEAHLEANP